jgi:hypothetical protein
MRGAGIEQIADALAIENRRMEVLGEDLYFSGRVRN